MHIRNEKVGLFSFQGKILLTYIFIIFIPFTIAFVIFASSAAREARMNNINYMVQLNEQINKSIDMFLSDVDRISFLHLIDSDVQSVLAKTYKQDSVEYVQDLRLMQNAIAHSAKLNRKILSVTLLGRNGNIYSNTGTDGSYVNQLNQWMTAAKTSERKQFLTPVYDGFVSYNRKVLLSYTRVLYDSRDMKEIGFIAVDIDFKTVRGILDNEIKGSLTNNSLVIQDDHIIYNSLQGGFGLQKSEEESVIEDINKKWGEGGEDIFNVVIKGREYLFAVSENESASWKVIQYVSLDDTINKSVNRSINFYATTMLLLLSVAILIGYILSRRMTRPINRLHMAMKQVEHGNLQPVNGEDGRRDDIGMLIKSFNHMIERLQESINKEYIAKMNQKKIELKMLQAQINPHFLYNTLSLISSIAEIEGVPQITRVTKNLSDMFRYNIKQKNIVKIREELEQINNYISIQQMRFPNKISLEATVDEALYNCSIIKFLLQPLVENAVYHGIEKLDGQGEIGVSVESEGENLLLSVCDNGRGMDERQTAELNKDLEGQNEQFVFGESQMSLGLRNVHYRIRTYYGEQYGLKVSSTIGVGTRVQICIPKICSGVCEEGMDA